MDSHEELPSIPLFFLRIKYFSCQPPGSGSPEICGQLPRAGLPPPPPDLALQASLQAQAALRGLGSQIPQKEDQNGSKEAGDDGEDSLTTGQTLPTALPLLFLFKLQQNKSLLRQILLTSSLYR